MKGPQSIARKAINMSQTISYPVPSHFKKTTHLTAKQYETLYQQSMQEPAVFWAEQAKRFISWFRPWTHLTQGDFSTADVQWFTGGTLNACYNCVDRHLPTRKNKVALLWEGNSPHQTQSMTYGQLHKKISRLANALLSHGIKKGDRVCIYLPMIPEVVIAMLACARIGAIHSVVFGGFSAEALKIRILDADCRLLITADEGFRGDKIVPFKENCDRALAHCPHVHTVIVVKRTGNPVHWNNARDIWYHDVVAAASMDCPIVHMDSNDPLFILYTSGSTGTPKGILHATGGYLVYVAMTHYYVFDHQENDVYWCTADVGWITGHSYLVYGPLANGATTLLFEGIPNHPDDSRYWDVVDKHKVTVFYTAPTALRALRREGDGWVKRTSRASLRLLGSVGEPINPDVWEWYDQVVGESRCPIVNTWWQTETGGIMMTPFPGATPLVPGSAGVPSFGIVLDIVDENGQPVMDNKPGRLVIKKPWPGMMQTIYGDRQRLIDTYFKAIPGCYLTGDGAHRDEAGLFWIAGRNDDVIKVSGHRMGTEELESAFISHPAVAEAAVVGIADDIKGEAIFAFITLKNKTKPTEALKKELIQHVREAIGSLATPQDIQWTDALPKTRSGKIMRRVLRHIARNELDCLGDLSTLADPTIIEKIIREKS